MTATTETPASHDRLPIPQEAFDWYDEYAHGLIDRRTFMERIATLTTATLTMGAILGVLMPNYAFAAQVSFNDPAIKATYETFPSPQGHGEGRGYLVVPAALTVQVAFGTGKGEIGGIIPAAVLARSDMFDMKTQAMGQLR